MIRLDVYLNEQGYVKSRQKAKSLIEDGCVLIDSVVIKKPSHPIDPNANPSVEIIDTCPYVSRGALKLERAINDISLNVSGKTCIDIGASTGGFTDCLLRHGAMKVYAIDSGTNQLDASLKSNPRVVSIEGYNARALSFEDIGELADIITVDVSFISQSYIIPPASKLLDGDGVVISLIKPQFEVGKSKIGKGGIVKKAEYRLDAALKIINCARENKLNCIYFSESPIVGGDGNVEFLAAFKKNSDNLITEAQIKNIIMKK